jgi:beta-glucosidase-like glycosyl hydrolase
LENQVTLTNMAQEMASIPLLITFDGEWGLAMRLKGTVSYPKNRVLGCIQDNKLLYEYGKEVARQCREIGVHVNFAPVADVDNNPLNPVINTRSFGGSPYNVADKVIAYSKGLEDGGVLSVSKHFPGHGDTNVDSHKALPVLSFTRERMDSIEMYPFRKAVEDGLGGVMVGHLEVPALSKKPASLSTEIIGILKEEFGFKGLVFTDALEMKGVSNNQNVAARALMAGNDMLLVPRNLKRELDGVLPVPQGKDALVLRQSRQGNLLLFRLSQRRLGVQFCHGDRACPVS